MKGRCYHDSRTDRLFYLHGPVPDFFDAAETMHISQSSLSKQIMKLEKELDLTLWDRSKRTAVLTPAGEFFIKKHLRFPDSIIVPWNQCPI